MRRCRRRSGCGGRSAGCGGAAVRAAAAHRGGARAARERGLARPDPAAALARRRASPEARAPQNPQQGVWPARSDCGPDTT